MLAFALIGETISNYKIAVFAIMFGTVCYITYFNVSDEAEAAEYEDVSVNKALIGYVLAFIGVLTLSGSIVLTRAVWDVEPMVVNFYTFLFSLPVYLALSFITAGEDAPS